MTFCKSQVSNVWKKHGMRLHGSSLPTYVIVCHAANTLQQPDHACMHMTTTHAATLPLCCSSHFAMSDRTKLVLLPQDGQACRLVLSKEVS